MKYSAILLTQMVPAVIAGNTMRWNDNPKAMNPLAEMQHHGNRPTGLTSIHPKINPFTGRPSTQLTRSQITFQKRTDIENSRSAPTSPSRGRRRSAIAGYHLLQRASYPGSNTNRASLPQSSNENPTPPPPTDDRMPMEFLRPRPRPRPQQHPSAQNGGAHVGILSTDSSPGPTRVTSPQPPLNPRDLLQSAQLVNRMSPAQQEVSASQERPRTLELVQNTSQGTTRKSLSLSRSSISTSPKSSVPSFIRPLKRKQSPTLTDEHTTIRTRRVPTGPLNMDWDIYNTGRAFIAEHAPESGFNKLPDLSNFDSIQSMSGGPSDSSGLASTASSSGSVVPQSGG